MTVVIPTYRRPRHLARCLASVFAQRRPPDDVVVITRRGDTESASVARSAHGTAPVIVGEVDRPGHLPPLQRARELLPRDRDIVVFTDDDAELWPDALARLERHYADARVGAVGGRVVQYRDGVAQRIHGGGRIGELTFYGRILGFHDAEPRAWTPREVAWLSGGCMSYRRSVLDRIAIRSRLNGDVAVCYEVDWGLQVRDLGYRVVFDPRVGIDHHNAPRHHGSERNSEYLHDSAVAFWTAHNATYVAMHHLRGARRVAFLIYAFGVGDKTSWAPVSVLRHLVQRRSDAWRGQLVAAYRGKAAGVRSYLLDRAS